MDSNLTEIMDNGLKATKNIFKTIIDDKPNICVPKFCTPRRFFDKLSQKLSINNIKFDVINEIPKDLSPNS
jgi:hypothetical protein